jgi:predicted Zn finger-like uncharacterized protein
VENQFKEKSMIVECKACHTKFSLDENLLKETGSKVRCSVCQHKFIMFPPKAKPSVDQGITETGGEPSAVPWDLDKTLVGEPLKKSETVPSGKVREEEVSELEETISEGMGKEEELEPLSFEDLSQLDSGLIEREKAKGADIDRAMDRAAKVEEGIRAEEELEREAGRETEAEEAFKPGPVIKKRIRSRMWLTVLLIGLVLAAAGSAFIVFKPGSFFMVKKPVSKEQVFDMGNRRLSFKDLNGSFVDSEKAGKLFIVKGLVTNDYPDRRSFIRIRSHILDSKGTVVKSKIVFAGNPFGDEELRSLSMEEIDTRLKDKSGKDKMNTNIHPKSSIPFTVVFHDLPEDMSEFTVEAISSSPAGK